LEGEPEAVPPKVDYIIAMDSSVYKALADMKPVPKDKLFGWEIADPCGYGIEAYERMTREIELELEKFLRLHGSLD
jgi:protein-tyrosine-phosphatase